MAFRNPTAARLHRQRLERRDRNAAMRPLLPRKETGEERKPEAERIMAAHDAELAKKLGLD